MGGADATTYLVFELCLWLPALVCLLALVISMRREPRRFRNAILLLVTSLFALFALSFQLGGLPVLILGPLAVLAPFVAIIYLLWNSVVVIRREGISLTTVLPALLAVGVGCVIVLPFVLLGAELSPLRMGFVLLLWLEVSWAAFTFVALLLYSWLYRHLPRKSSYDYIIVHGAGLDGKRPTPLLAGRIERAVDVWRSQDRRPILVASGGQGADEQVSEASCIRDYLIHDCHVPSASIVLEDRSTTTEENLEYSKQIMDERSGEDAYRCCLVTSDYHVFRAVEYARDLGLKADGVGSKTASYYFPAAFAREYAAITRAHWWPYAVLALVAAAVTASMMVS